MFTSTNQVNHTNIWSLGITINHCQPLPAVASHYKQLPAIASLCYHHLITCSQVRDVRSTSCLRRAKCIACASAAGVGPLSSRSHSAARGSLPIDMAWYLDPQAHKTWVKVIERFESPQIICINPKYEGYLMVMVRWNQHFFQGNHHHFEPRNYPTVWHVCFLSRSYFLMMTLIMGTHKAGWYLWWWICNTWICIVLHNRIHRSNYNRYLMSQRAVELTGTEV